MAKTSPSNAGVPVRSLVRKRRFHMFQGQKTKPKEKQYYSKFNEGFKNEPHQKIFKHQKKGQFLSVTQAHSCGCTGPTSCPSAAGVVNTTSLIPVVVPCWSCLCCQQARPVCGFVSAGRPTPAPRDCFLIVQIIQEKRRTFCGWGRGGVGTQSTQGAEVKTFSFGAPLSLWVLGAIGQLSTFRHPRNMGEQAFSVPTARVELDPLHNATILGLG